MFARQMLRKFGTSAARLGHDVGGRPGGNLPFDINNRHKLTAYFILFFGSGLAIPFLVVRHGLLED